MQSNNKYRNNSPINNNIMMKKGMDGYIIEDVINGMVQVGQCFSI